jgi:tetratricopeptide (TPR) repeat protein
MLGKYQDAVECFQRATQCEPRKVELHEELGHWLGRLGRKDEAVTAYTHAISLNPRRYQAHTALAVHRIQCVAVLEREIRPISAHRTRLRSNHREDEPSGEIFGERSTATIRFADHPARTATVLVTGKEPAPWAFLGCLALNGTMNSIGRQCSLSTPVVRSLEPHLNPLLQATFACSTTRMPLTRTLCRSNIS